MRFFRFQKKPLFNRGFCRKSSKSAIFDPPQETPKKPPFWPFWPFWTPLLGSLFDPPKKPQKTPKTTLFDPPKTDPPQKSWKMALLAKTGVFKQDLNRKRGGGWGFTQGPPKKAIFGHFCPFWPFLPILAIFGHFLATFWPPKFWPQNVSGNGDFWPKKGENPPRNPPGQTDYI